MNPIMWTSSRPPSYRGPDTASDQAWQKERTFFPHCHRCVLDSLKRIADLGDNWDGYGAKPITPAMVAAVRRFVDRLHGTHDDLTVKPGTETACLTPHLAASSSGTVQLEWQYGGRSLELEFETPTEIRYLKWWPDHEVADEEASYPSDDMDQSASLIGWVLTGDDVPAE